MSYSRRYSEVISGSVSRTVNYGASQNGGSMTVSMDWHEPVDITIYVDTDPFDDSVSTIKHHLDFLTGAVVTTEALQIAEKTKAASDIARSVTDGFFTLIRSDLTQQMAALKSKLEALVMQLSGHKEQLVRIQQGMGRDYAMITARYTVAFETLDKDTRELISVLDAPLLKTQADLKQHLDRPCGKNTSNVPTVFGGESSRTQAVMASADVRARMNQLLMSALSYLATERKFGRDLNALLVDRDGDEAPSRHLPALFMVADGPQGQVERLFTPVGDLQRPSQQALLADQFREGDLPWAKMGQRPQLENYLQAMVDGLDGPDPAHMARVRATILKLWSTSKPVTLPC